MKFITILLCKVLAFVGEFLGKGTSLPGKIALKLYPDILSKLTLPEHIIAVTGSNGKTSTVEMIARVLTQNGKQVVWNKAGSNQIEGVATLLLKCATLSGKVNADVVLLESDERFARLSFQYIKPTVFIVTNLYRDQLTRNGHPYRIYDYIQMALDLIPDTKLILNGDDPIVRKFGIGRENVSYFGMDENKLSTKVSDALFNDCCYCPVCKKPMTYDYFHYTHLGGYHCDSCGYRKPDTQWTVSDMDLEQETITINGQKIALEFASKYNVYNLCAAYAAADLMEIDVEKIANVLSDFIMENGRVVRFEAGENKGLLITSKHENSTSYNQSLGYICAQKEKFDLVIIVDAISRKYYTAETSWLWDISFEMLKDSAADRIYLSGKYAYDLGLRFQLAGIDRAIVEPDLNKMGQAIRQKTENKLYAVTCFSDKDKLFGQVKVTGPVAK